MKRTTIVTDENQLFEIEQIAKQRKSSVSLIVREAISEYIVKRKHSGAKLEFIGQTGSGRHDVSQRAEELIEQGLSKK